MCSDDLKAQSTNQPVAGVSDLNLSSEQIGELTAATKTGDGEAAFRLYFYYQTVKNDYATAWGWLKKSAQLGNPKAQYTLSYQYTNNPKIKDAALAQYWLKKAAANGSVEAKKKLQEAN
jgi:TPR repeat protein